MTHGVHAQATNHYNGLELSVKHASTGLEYQLELRAFNDGAAFRHIVPEGKTELRTPDEATTFRVPSGSVVWHHDLGGHYEDTFDKSNANTMTNGLWVEPPMTFKLPAVEQVHAGGSPMSMKIARKVVSYFQHRVNLGRTWKNSPNANTKSFRFLPKDIFTKKLPINSRSASAPFARTSTPFTKNFTSSREPRRS